MNGVGAELAREIAVGRVGLRDHEDAARALVEAMDQSGPGTPSIAGLPRLGALTVTDVMHQPVQQRARPVARAGVHHETGRLVHHQDLRVLVEHVQREGLGLDHGGVAHRHVTGDHVARADQAGGLGPAAVDGDQPAVDPPLGGRP